MLDERKIYRASGYWSTNVSGAVLGGIGGALLMLTVLTIALWMTGFARDILIWFAILLMSFVATGIAFYPGNLVATYPLAVEIEPSKQIILIAPMKRLIIPIEDILDVRNSPFQQGYLVRLNRRQGLLKSFVIHWFFGPERTALADAIENIASRKTM
jgi:hypothetical protein